MDRKVHEFFKTAVKEINEESKKSEPILTKKEKNEFFNKPDHYHKGGIDVIGYLEQHFPNEGTYTVSEGFYIGNIIKYVSRYKNKNGLKDLEKATDYLKLLLKTEEAKPRKTGTEETDVATLLTNAYESDDVFTKNALLLEALDLLTIKGTGK